MSKDSDDCEVMNELFDGGVHWHPVAEYDQNDNKIRDLTPKEMLEWVRKERER